MNPSRRVLITSSRTWTNVFLIHNTLTSLHWMLAGDNDITLVSGACPTGGDYLCEQTALELGWSLELHPADWARLGKRAGFIRNDEMVAKGADVCVAFIFDDSKGATYTANAAQKAGIETLRFRRYSLGVSLPESAKAFFPERSDPDILRAVEAIERRERLPEEQGALW